MRENGLERRQRILLLLLKTHRAIVSDRVALRNGWSGRYLWGVAFHNRLLRFVGVQHLACALERLLMKLLCACQGSRGSGHELRAW